MRHHVIGTNGAADALREKETGEDHTFDSSSGRFPLYQAGEGPGSFRNLHLAIGWKPYAIACNSHA
jgi:hypothetical protein